MLYKVICDKTLIGTFVTDSKEKAEAVLESLKAQGYDARLEEEK